MSTPIQMDEKFNPEGFTYDMVMVFVDPTLNKKKDDDKIPGNITPGPKIVKRLKEAGLKVCLYKSVQKDEVYCLIGATEERLETEAHRTEFELALDRDRCLEYGLSKGLTLAKRAKERDEFTDDDINENIFQYIYGKFTKETRQLYVQHNAEGPQHAGSVFRQVDRLKLIVSIVEAETKLGGAGLAVGNLLKEKGGHLKAFFALHDDFAKDQLLKTWISYKSIFTQPVELIRDYFGEEIALYFRFLQYYNRCLVWVSILGFIFFIIAQAKASFKEYYKVNGMWVFAIVMAIWATLFVEFWKRIEADRRMAWGQSKFEENEQPRPEFTGKWVRSPITGKLEEKFPIFQAVLRKVFSQTVIITFVCLVIGSVIGVLILRGVLVRTSGANGKVYAGIIMSVQIQILNAIYGMVATKLNNFENHRTDTEWKDALIAKSFLFKFVNSYNSLFYMAFGQQFESDASLKCSYNPSVPGEASCLYNLQIQLATVFISSIIINNGMELGIPFLMNLYQTWAQSKSEDKEAQKALEAKKTSPEKQFELSEYESTFGDYDEMAVQFGYVVLFVLAFPITPLFALANNFIEVFVDAKKLVTLTRRPEPRGAGDIGTWSDIFSVIGCVAIVTNCAVAVFGFDEFDHYANGSVSGKLWIFFIAEHAIFLFRFAIQYWVPDVPLSVTVHLARQDYVTDVLINGAEETEDVKERLLRERKDSTAMADNTFFSMDQVPDEVTKDEHLTVF